MWDSGQSLFIHALFASQLHELSHIHIVIVSSPNHTALKTQVLADFKTVDDRCDDNVFHERALGICDLCSWRELIIRLMSFLAHIYGSLGFRFAGSDIAFFRSGGVFGGDILTNATLIGHC